VLFEARFREPIADGSVTLTFRRWKRSQAVAGHVYRTTAGRIGVDDVRVVSPGAISDAATIHSSGNSVTAAVTHSRPLTTHPAT